MSALPAAPPPPRHEVTLRVLPPPADLDLGEAWEQALAPHRVAAERDTHLAEVIPLRRGIAPAAAAPPARPAGSLRRRVVAVLAMALAVVLASLWLDASTTAGAADGGHAPIGGSVLLEPGQSLWQVAEAHTPAGGDVRQTLAQIRGLNGFAGATVPAWTLVVLPAVD